MFSSTIANLGSGIRMIDHKCLPNSALSETKSSIQENASTDTYVSIVRNENTVHQQLGLATATMHNKLASEVDLFSNEKRELVNRIQWDRQKIYVMIRKTLKESNALGSPVTLNQIATSIIAEAVNGAESKSNTVNGIEIDVFFNTYGNRYINQIKTGAEVIIIAELSTDTSGVYKGKYQKANSHTKEKQKTVENNSTASFKTTHKDNQTNFSEVATYGEHDVTNYWIHTVGLENGKTFVAKTKNFADFLDSVQELLKFDKTVLSPVRLGYQTLPYNTVSIEKPTVTTNTGVSVSRIKITCYLLKLEERAQDNKTAHLDILDFIYRASYFLNKYDKLIKMFCEEAADQEEYKAENQTIMENGHKLQTMISQLTRWDKKLVNMTNVENSPDVEPYAIARKFDLQQAVEVDEISISQFTKFDQYESLLRKIIKEYHATRGYKPLATIPISDGKSNNFNLSYDNSAKYIYLKLHNVNPENAANSCKVELQVQTVKSSIIPCRSAQYKSLFADSIKATGNYIATNSIPRGADLKLVLADKDNKSKYEIDFLQCDEEQPFNKLAF